MMIRRAQATLVLAFMASIFVVLAGCSHAADSVGGETNWFKCEHDDQCGEHSACHSGTCVPERSADASASTTPGATGAPGRDPGEPFDMSGEPSAQVAALGLAMCPGASAIEWLVDFSQPLACQAGECPMQGIALAALSDQSALVLAADGSADVSPGTPNVALLDHDALGSFATIPGGASAGQAFAAGKYVAALGESWSSFLYAWQDDALVSMAKPDGIIDIAAAGTDVAVAGNLNAGSARTEWLASYDAMGTERWHIGAPADAASSKGEVSISVAFDESDGSLAWLVGRYVDDTWKLSIVRVDRGGNALWTTHFMDEGPGRAPDWLVNPGIAAAGGVTSIAGAGTGLSFRQYDDAGAEIRRWDGLATDSLPNATPLVADDQGNVYVAWLVSHRAVILRFAPSGDPCLLADVPNQFPVDLVLQDQKLLFMTWEGVGRVQL